MPEEDETPGLFWAAKRIKDPEGGYEITVELVIELLRQLPPNMIVEVGDPASPERWSPIFQFVANPERGTDSLKIQRSTPLDYMTPTQHLKHILNQFGER